MKRDSIIFGLLRYVLHGALIVIALMLIKEYSAKCYDLGYRVFKEPAVTMVGEGKKLTITITDKVSAKSLGELLEAKGLIRDKTLFILQYYCSEYRKEMKAGTYELKSSMTAEEMFAVMAGYELEEEEE
jgi:UPF0755 protein